MGLRNWIDRRRAAREASRDPEWVREMHAEWRRQAAEEDAHPVPSDMVWGSEGGERDVAQGGDPSSDNVSLRPHRGVADAGAGPLPEEQRMGNLEFLGYEKFGEDEFGEYGLAWWQPRDRVAEAEQLAGPEDPPERRVDTKTAGSDAEMEDVQEPQPPRGWSTDASATPFEMEQEPPAAAEVEAEREHQATLQRALEETEPHQEYQCDLAQDDLQAEI